jgi:hypothetical protein
LTISGNPGSQAIVTYGSADAGTITFGADGSATVTFGKSLIDLAGLTNPLVRVSYSDGTAGSAIESRRDSL